jgi:hypothetical protein
VARFSQHMLGRAMDFYIPGVPLEDLRAMGLRLARGGVGFYPTSGSPFVHMDTGSVRMWPRMTHEQLVRVFPDGKTVQIPTDGRPLQGYALALAEIQQRGNNPSDNSVDAARNSGVEVGAMVASEDHHSINPIAKLFGLRKGEEDDDADSYAPATAPAPASTTRTKAKTVAVAAVERVKAAVTNVAAQTKLIRTNSFAVAARTPAVQKVAPQAQTDDRFASLSPNQVIFARGYWQGQPDGAAAAAKPKSARGVEVASADPNATGTVGPLPGASDDRVPPQLALAYAEQSPSHAIAVAARAAVDKAGAVIGESETTVAVKGVNDQPKTSVQKAIQLAAAAVKVSERLDNPWLRAIILSPSVQRFLSTLAFGARDVTYLASLMVKPTSSVMMTFSSDPNRGLSQDHFSGSAIVFLTTVTYPTRTASLQ